MAASDLVAGIDFGSDSVRVMLLDVTEARTDAVAQAEYVRWAERRYCDADLSVHRQHPLDHIEALEACFAQLTRSSDLSRVRAVAVDSTGSTPAPVDAEGRVLALRPEFANDPDAMFWLWKDHSAEAEAAEINAVLDSGRYDVSRTQGEYSSEWWWAKILRAERLGGAVSRAAVSWIEHADWVAHLLSGGTDVATIPRSACAYGHKVLYSAAHGGLPPRALIAELNPDLARIFDTLPAEPDAAGTSLGTVCVEWARRLGLPDGVVIGAGSLDAHAAAVGVGIRPGEMVKVIGTSTVDLFLPHSLPDETEPLRSLCNIAEDTIVPGHLGGETSQAAFGDLFSWYAGILRWPLRAVLEAEVADSGGAPLIDRLEDRFLGTVLPALESTILGRTERATPIALDWINGRRYPFPDSSARGAIAGIGVGTDAGDIYLALLDAAVLGSRFIQDQLLAAGIQVHAVTLVGGIAQRSELICQMLADALGVEVAVADEPQASARGAAIHAAIAAGTFGTAEEVRLSLAAPVLRTFVPTPEGRARMDTKIGEYLRLGVGTGQLPPCVLEPPMPKAAA